MRLCFLDKAQKCIIEGMTENDFLGKLIAVRRDARGRARTGDLWIDRFGDSSAYEETFKMLLDGRTFKEMIGEWKENGKKVFTLDLLGFGWVFLDLPVDRALSVGLTNLAPTKGEGNIDQRIQMIAGDIYSKKTWKKVADWLNSQEGPDKKFKLILCRPVGAITMVPESLGLLYYFLSSMYELLSNDGGIIFTEVPLFAHGAIQEWAKTVNRYTGIEISYSLDDYFGKGEKFDKSVLKMKLVKKKDAPSQLPIVGIP